MYIQHRLKVQLGTNKPKKGEKYATLMMKPYRTTPLYVRIKKFFYSEPINDIPINYHDEILSFAELAEKYMSGFTGKKGFLKDEDLPEGIVDAIMNSFVSQDNSARELFSSIELEQKNLYFQ